MIQMDVQLTFISLLVLKRLFMKARQGWDDSIAITGPVCIFQDTFEYCFPAE